MDKELEDYGAEICEKIDKRAPTSDDDDVFERSAFSKKADNRTEWQMSFPWDQQIDDANRMIFGNEQFREN